MAPKLSQFLVFSALFAISAQYKIGERKQAKYPKEVELQNIVDHLKTHAYKSSQHGSHLNPNGRTLMKVKTLNLHINGPDGRVVKNVRTDSLEDRSCKTGRCGCSGNRCSDRADGESDLDQTNKEVQRFLEGIQKESDELTDGTHSVDKYEDEEVLRCRYGRCGRGCCGRHERADDQDEEDDVLRCRYGRCGRGCCGRRPHRSRDNEDRTYKAKLNDETSLQSQLEQLGNTYKLNDDLDAIVVDLSKFNNVLDKLADKSSRATKSSKLSKNRGIGVEYLLEDARNAAVDPDQEDDEQYLVNRIVNEVLLKGNREDDDDPVRPSELVEYYLEQKRRLVGNALNFVKNSRGRKDIGKLSADQKYQLQRLRSEVQKLGPKADQKEVEKVTLNIVLGEGARSKVLPHNEDNNNVYVPKWVHRAVKDSREDLRTKQRMFPLTNKQKLKLMNKTTKKLWRRNLNNNVNDYGVPFQLQVQGLGQVNP